MSSYEPEIPELEAAKIVAERLADCLEDVPARVQFGALSLLAGAMFAKGIIESERLQSFDDFTKVVRNTIKESLG